MADNRTVWDRDWDGPGTETVWDRDWDGPGTETFWDLVPANLGRSFLAVFRAPGRFARFVQSARKAKFR